MGNKAISTGKSISVLQGKGSSSQLNVRNTSSSQTSNVTDKSVRDSYNTANNLAWSASTSSNYANAFNKNWNLSGSGAVNLAFPGGSASGVSSLDDSDRTDGRSSSDASAATPDKNQLLKIAIIAGAAVLAFFLWKK